jgi:hypothetical protein
MSLKHAMRLLCTCILMCLLHSAIAQQIYPYRKGNLYGFADSNAKVLVKPQYKSVQIEWLGSCYYTEKDSAGKTYMHLYDKGKLRMISAGKLSKLNHIIDEYFVDAQRFCYIHQLRSKSGKLLSKDSFLAVEIAGYLDNKPHDWVVPDDSIKYIGIDCKRLDGRHQFYLYNTEEQELIETPLPLGALDISFGYDAYGLEYRGDTLRGEYKSAQKAGIFEDYYFGNLQVLTINYADTSEHGVNYAVWLYKDNLYYGTEWDLLAFAVKNPLPEESSIEEEPDIVVEQKEASPRQRLTHVEYRFLNDTSIKEMVDYQYTNKSQKWVMPFAHTKVVLLDANVKHQIGKQEISYDNIMLVKLKGKFGVLYPNGQGVPCKYDSILAVSSWNTNYYNTAFIVGQYQADGQMLFGLIDDSNRVIMPMKYNYLNTVDSNVALEARRQLRRGKMLREPRRISEEPKMADNYKVHGNVFVYTINGTNGCAVFDEDKQLSIDSIDAIWHDVRPTNNNADISGLDIGGTEQSINIVYKKNNAYGVVHKYYDDDKGYAYQSNTKLFKYKPIANLGYMFGNYVTVVTRSTTRFLVVENKGYLDIMRSDGIAFFED